MAKYVRGHMTKTKTRTTKTKGVPETLHEAEQKHREADVASKGDKLRQMMSKVVPEEQKLDDHKQEREEQEKVVFRSETAFIAACLALRLIERNEWFKVYADKFSEYCFIRFDMSRTQVTRYSDAADVMENLAECETLPTREGQCRELKAVKDKAKQVEVWNRCLATGNDITAVVIRQEIRNVMGSSAPEQETREPRKPLDVFLTETSDKVTKYMEYIALYQHRSWYVMEQIEKLRRQFDTIEAKLGAAK